MSNENRTGIVISPLTLAVAGVLWGVLFSLVAWTLSEVVSLGKTMNSIPAEIADHEARIRALERKP